MFSVSLDLPEFEVVKQVFLEDCNLLHVEKNTTEEHCSYCGTYLHLASFPNTLILVSLIHSD